MRILFVTQVMLDKPYGGPRHVQAIVKAWAQKGHSVCLVAPGEEPEIAGVERIRPPKWLKPGLRMEACLAVLALHKARAFKPDIAYVRTSATSSFAPVSLKGLGVPLVLELNGPLLDELRMLRRSELAVQLVGALQRQVFGLANYVVAVDTQTARHAARQLGAQRVEVVENGADIDVARPGDPITARRRLGLPVEGPILGFAGTLAPELRFDLLEAAIRRLNPTPLLVIAGDGPQRSFFEQNTNPNIRWLGARSHEEAVDVLRAATVCVNVRDGIVGMKALEYAAVGRRFVTFKVEGSERLESLFKEPAAFFVNERTPDALAIALQAALEEEAKSGPLPPSAIDIARTKVSWTRTAENLENLFRRLLTPI